MSHVTFILSEYRKNICANCLRKSDFHRSINAFKTPEPKFIKYKLSTEPIKKAYGSKNLRNNNKTPLPVSGANTKRARRMQTTNNM